MRWTLGELEEVTGGRLHPGTSGPSPIVSGMGIDTRTLKGGQMWVAIRGQRDGHDYAPAAIEAGAVAMLVEHRLGTAAAELVVADTGAALLEIGRAARRRMGQAAVVGITGSVGKTSTKDLLAAAVARARRSVASPGSFNNELGLPLTLANAPQDAEVVVLEMGARGPGHIALLCDIGRPDIGVVTAVAAAHTEMFGDLDGVAGAKGELVEALPDTGAAVLNADDPRVLAMAARAASGARIVTYSAIGDPTAEVRASGVAVDGELRPTFRADTPWGPVAVRLESRGRHQVGNALAALAAAGLVGVGVEEAAEAMRSASRSPHRMDVRRTPGGATLIDDAYNANPASMAAALLALAALPARRRLALLGVMAELGEESEAEHERVVALAGELGIEVIAIGTSAYGMPSVDSGAEVADLIAPLDEGTAVLVKASRAASLERLVARLLDEVS